MDQKSKKKIKNENSFPVDEDQTQKSKNTLFNANSILYVF